MTRPYNAKLQVVGGNVNCNMKNRDNLTKAPPNHPCRGCSSALLDEGAITKPFLP